jgi:murein DD-endopeptidase MepM/ murein hydrolase activator NlpD
LPAPRPPMPGIYHRVEKGQTLWRISRMYGVELDELAQINRIKDNAKIEIGQMVFIPRKPALPPAPARPIGDSDDFIWPLKGRVTAAFGQGVGSIASKGIYIQPLDNRQVVASRAGRVVFCCENFGVFGKTVIIDHGDGFSTVYAHNGALLVKPGENIQRGSVIAEAGLNTRPVTNCLYFEIRKGPAAQNPLFYLP